ncbi:hypothetical protein GGR58DRAFT_509490 [Xylaria digitata]|nr:hypothetical protein GGR58DRAFT_509490 [Xylaria digitata]
MSPRFQIALVGLASAVYYNCGSLHILLISAYPDVPHQDKAAPCYITFKSPVSTAMLGCGETQKCFQDETCGTVNLDDTFMAQFRCGSGDCTAAGIPGQTGLAEDAALFRSAKFGHGTNTEYIDFLSAAARGGGDMQSLRIAVNSTCTEPTYVGTPQVPSETKDTDSGVSRRDSVCDGDWAPDAGFEDLLGQLMAHRSCQNSSRILKNQG